ncbi:hypothetical protein B0H14DRAFT_3143147 [Mycena olivaceomarginata]|nr:hypothetical protein B0H14DRAFT_3143147 [Mycena olivaceomarginata]
MSSAHRRQDRMLALQQDPHCSDIQENSVLCLPCNKQVNLGKASTYNVGLWEAHMSRPTHQKKVAEITALNQYGASQMGCKNVDSQGLRNEVLEWRCSIPQLPIHSLTTRESFPTLELNRNGKANERGSNDKQLPYGVGWGGGGGVGSRLSENKITTDDTPPGISTLRSHTILPASPGIPTQAEIEASIDSCSDGEPEPTGPPIIVHHILMLDEIVVEQRPRWDDKTNMILGTCRECSHRVSLGACDCGELVEQGSASAVQCSRAGCETEWVRNKYHPTCMGIKDDESVPKNWCCVSCVRTKKAKKQGIIVVI